MLLLQREIMVLLAGDQVLEVHPASPSDRLTEKNEKPNLKWVWVLLWPCMQKYVTDKKHSESGQLLGKEMQSQIPAGILVLPAAGEGQASLQR